MIMPFILSLLRGYRKLLYILHGRPLNGLLDKGMLCSVEDPTFDLTHGDVVHPCIRYIEEGFEGHKWWMVYTPYYSGNDSVENPRLCYADSNENDFPTKWKFYCTIKEKPDMGYNSDPTMLFKDGKLFVFWRECNTPNTKKNGCSYATFGCEIKGKTVSYIPDAQLISKIENHSGIVDKEVSPNFMVFNNNIIAYAMHLRFTPNFIFYLPSRIGSFLYRHNIFNIFDALGICKEERSLGVALWKGTSLNNTFQYEKTVNFSNVCRLYQPWHMDIFIDKSANNDKVVYAIIQTSMKFTDICIAWSKDGEHFCFYKKPLLTSTTIGMEGLYKPTAVIVGNTFCLYYTIRDNQDPRLNRLYVTSISWSVLLQLLEID